MAGLVAVSLAYWVLCSLLCCLRKGGRGRTEREGTGEKKLPFLLLCLFNIRPNP